MKPHEAWLIKAEHDLRKRIQTPDVNQARLETLKKNNA